VVLDKPRIAGTGTRRGRPVLLRKQDIRVHYLHKLWLISTEMPDRNPGLETARLARSGGLLRIANKAPARTGGVAVGHNVGRNPGLLLALQRHAAAYP
jgi:hypothetical protein